VSSVSRLGRTSRSHCGSAYPRAESRRASWAELPRNPRANPAHHFALTTTGFGDFTSAAPRGGLPRMPRRTPGTRLLEPTLTCEDNAKIASVGVAGRYSNRPDLLEQLRKVAAVLSDGGQDDSSGVKVATECVVRSRRLRDRFSPEDLQAMIDFYLSGATAMQVGGKFGVSVRSVGRLLHEHGVRRRPPRPRHSS
jgi:hypothetical protein